MEYADSGTLRDYLNKNFNRLSWNDKYNLAYQLACSVICLHEEEIVHRDLVIFFFLINIKIFYELN
jgi:serine/threonine protein kinase